MRILIKQSFLSCVAVQIAMNNVHVPLELDPILKTLLSYVKAGAITKRIAIQKIEAIKTALEKYKAKQYTAMWPRLLCSTPEIVKEKIDPAIEKVNSALVILKRSVINFGSLLGWATLGVGVVIAVNLAAAGVKDHMLFNKMNSITFFEKENIARYWAEILTDNYVPKDDLDYVDLKEDLRRSIIYDFNVHNRGVPFDKYSPAYANYKSQVMDVCKKNVCKS